jgi:hypothetical protein
LQVHVRYTPEFTYVGGDEREAPPPKVSPHLAENAATGMLVENAVTGKLVGRILA